MVNENSTQSEQPTPNNRPPFWQLGIVFVVVAAVTFGVMALSNNQAPQDETNGVARAVSAVNSPAPNFESVFLNGDEVQLSDFRGRLVFLNFWATWCTPCRRELPAFEEFMAEQGEDGPIILAVNVEESPEVITMFFENIGVENIPVILDESGDISNLYTVFNLPVTYVIDAEGIIRSIKLGETKITDLYDYVDQLSAD
ncbi:MAG: hypothetical protein D6712_20210 [Chloroflexi bacterium]|nr:MAG: hypothetical protein D6712_20210 [Chloroflexota bacterium]